MTRITALLLAGLLLLGAAGCGSVKAATPEAEKVLLEKAPKIVK